MADVFQSIESTLRSFQESLSVKTAYGEPVSANGLTVIPVSKVRFGFGGGGGGGAGGEAEQAGEGYGGGMGGGGDVTPIGYVEIGDSGTRWVPLEPPRGEVFLRMLALAPAFIPTGRGRGGWLRRIFLVLAGQAIAGGVLRQRLGDGGIRRFLPRRAGEEAG